MSRAQLKRQIEQQILDMEEKAIELRVSIEDISAEA
jgi:hypothetical protein